MKLNKVKVDNFRKFTDLNFILGKRITVISGVNGIGKSSLMSLIASAAGTTHKRLGGGNFEPLFQDYFEIENSEPFKKYQMWIDTDIKVGSEKYPFTKRISFSDNTKSNRNIRPIPRTSAPIDNPRKITGLQAQKDSHSNSGRFSIPTIYLSLARLMPPVEGNQSEKKLTSRNKIEKSGYSKKYADYYNSVLYRGIDNHQQASLVGKQVGKRTNRRLFVKVNGAESRTISAGQDAVGNIVSALTDFYALKNSLGKKYIGGLLCIDEVDATLHPSAVLKLMKLLENVSDPENLNLQVIVTTHSLTILKEICKLEEQNKDNYRLLYFVDTNVPKLMQNPTYRSIRTDLFDQISSKPPKVKIFTEDDFGGELLNLLLRSDKLDEKKYYNHFDISGTKLGGDQLISLPKADPIFRKVIMVPDGDRRKKDPVNQDGKKYIKDIVTDEWGKQKTDRETEKNVLFLPSQFSPEIFVYKIVEEYIVNNQEHSSFWNTTYYSTKNTDFATQRVEEYLHISNKTKYSEIHENKKWSKYALDFLKETGFLDDYLKYGKQKVYLEKFYKDAIKTLDYGLTLGKIGMFD